MKKKMFAMLMVAILAVTMLCGCEALNRGVSSLKGSLVGNEFQIDTFDNFGQQVMSTHGQKVDVDPIIVETKSYNSEVGWTTTKELSSAIDISIDGHQLISCGDTMVFYDTSLTPEYQFDVGNIDSESDGITDNTLITAMVNKVKNAFGKSVIVVIKSQTGYPIYAFSGDSVNWEVPDDLPKFTLLSIDGKPLYIHRGNYQIIDKALLD